MMIVDAMFDQLRDRDHMIMEWVAFFLHLLRGECDQLKVEESIMGIEEMHRIGHT